jgi:hypothetical protein
MLFAQGLDFATGFFQCEDPDFATESHLRIPDPLILGEIKAQAANASNCTQSWQMDVEYEKNVNKRSI